MQNLEAVLMLAREPLPSRKLAQLAFLEDGTQARTLIRKLNRRYDETGRSFRVEEVAGGYQLLTRSKFASWLRRLSHVPGEVRLSSPALETLAVVAYRQPVLKADIEAIRGVNCGEILHQLMQRDLVRIAGRSQDLGRPYLYGVTKRFLQIFGVRSLDDLPRAEILRSAPLPPVHKPASTGHHTSSDSTFITETLPSPNNDKENDVSVSIASELTYEDEVARKFGAAAASNVRLEDEEDDFDDEDADEDDDFEDDDEEDEDFDDEDLDDEDEEDFEDEDLEDEEWEEVDDEDEEWDEEDEEGDEEEDEEWDDEDDDLDEDDEEWEDEDEE